jgi:hypothetical protein
MGQDGLGFGFFSIHLCLASLAHQEEGSLLLHHLGQLCPMPTDQGAQVVNRFAYVVRADHNVSINQQGIVWREDRQHVRNLARHTKNIGLERSLLDLIGIHYTPPAHARLTLPA